MFHLADDDWKILYVYRMESDPHVWMYCLESVEVTSSKDQRLRMVLEDLSRKDRTPRIVYQPFKDEAARCRYFINIPALGDRIVKSTQELLGLKKVS